MGFSKSFDQIQATVQLINMSSRGSNLWPININIY